MAKDNEVPVLTNDALMQMLLDTQKQLAVALKEQTEALRESRKPYVDPAVLAQKQADLEERRKQVQLTLLQRERTKAICPHLRVDSEGNPIEGKYNIKWMQHGPNIILGVCGTCFSQFDTKNPKDRAFLQKDASALRNMGRSREIYNIGQ